MGEIDIESVRLTRKLGSCSNALARTMTRLKDIESIKHENDVIVFITYNPDEIQSALEQSLKNNSLSLDYIFTTVEDFFITDTTTQVFLVTNDPQEANTLKAQNLKSIVIDMRDSISSKNINHYVELMVKNIQTHMKFAIRKQTEQGGL